MNYFVLLSLLILCCSSVLAIEVSDVSIDGITEHAARFYFETDVPASTRISWEANGITRNQTNAALNTKRQWYISGLAPDTEYDLCLQGYIGDEISECYQTSVRTLPESEPISDPEPPREYVDVSMPTMSGTTFEVNSADCNDPQDGLQALINQAQGGDTIEIPAGMVCNGIYTLPARPQNDDDWIIIRTNTSDSSLPLGERITPNDTSKMAKLQSNSFTVLLSGPNSWCPGSGSLMYNKLNNSLHNGMNILYRCLDGVAKEYEPVPFTNGSRLPATCTPGSWFFNSTDGLMSMNKFDQYAYQCVAPNEYVQMRFSQNGEPLLVAEDGAHHYRLIGLELTRVPPATNDPHPSILQNNGARILGSLQANLISLKEGSHHIILDRVYIHGNGFPERIRVGLGWGSDYSALIDSRIDRIQIWKSNGFAGGEEAPVAIHFGAPGPALIHNNYIDTPGITVFADGGVNPPHDVVISNNHITASLNYFDGSADPDEYFHFNRHRFELKRGVRFVIKNNLIENSWSVVNQGALIALTPRPPFGGSNAPYNYTTGVRDILFENNVLRNAPQFLILTGGNGLTSAVPNPITTQRIKFHNNLIYNITGSVWNSPKQYLGGTGKSGVVFSVGGGVQDLVITHNTIFNNTGDFVRLFHYEGGNTRNSDLRLNDNLLVNPGFAYFMLGNGVMGRAVGSNLNYLNNVWVEGEDPAWAFEGNTIMWGREGNTLALDDDFSSSNEWMDSLDEVGFFDIAANDFSLREDSVLNNRASDGTDPGVDWSIISLVLNQEVVETPIPPPPPAPSPNDLDGDGQVDISDVVFLINLVVQETGGDINDDGEGNIIDIMQFVRQLLDNNQI